MVTNATKKTAISPDRYWASEPPDRMPELVLEQFRRYWEALDARALPGVWKSAYRLYYGQDPEGGYATSHAVRFGGKQGEAVRIRSNQFRSLIRRFLTMALADRPDFEASAVNDGSDAQAQTTLVKQLLEYALDDGGMEQSVYDASDIAIPFGESYVHQPWDYDAGEPERVKEVPELDESGQPVIDEETGQPRTRQVPVMTGDARIEVLSPVDVARDLDQPPRAAPQWLILRRWAKKWDLLAKFPDKADAIRSASATKDATRGLWRSEPREGTDWIPEFWLYHAKTPAMPSGRVLRCIEGAMLTDGALAYDGIPVHRIRPASESESDTAYSDFWDLMATQDGYDAVISAIVSIINIQEMPNLLATEGQEVHAEMMTGGGRLISWRADGKSPPPQWMPPPPIGEGTLQAREILLSDLETNSGINAVSRGNAGENNKAASSQALAQSMAVQYASSFTRAVASLYRELATARVRLWQRFATTERTAEVVGPDEAPLVMKFKAADIAAVRQVRVEVAPALLRTHEGKTMIADKLLEAYGADVIPPQTYMTVLSTGRLDPVWKRQMGQVANIRAENEALSKGQPVEIMQTDNHLRHAQEHACLLDDPIVRRDQQRRAGIIEHIAAHAVEYDALRVEQPALFAMTQEPLPGPMMEMIASLAPPAPAGPPDAGGPPADPEEPPAPRADVPGAGSGGDLPLMPAPPGGERLPPEGAAPPVNA